MRVYTILVLTEVALVEHDAARIAQLHDQPIRATVLVARDGHGNRLVETLDDVALGRLGGHDEPADPDGAARAALEHSLEVLRAAGVECEGSVVDGDPVGPTVTAAGDADEVIVLTEPHLVEEALRRDWASRVREATRKPVLHAVAGTDRVVS